MEKGQQGKVRWCTECQRVWQKGFDCGLQNHDEFMNAGSITEAAFIVDRVAPYLVRE